MIISLQVLYAYHDGYIFVVVIVDTHGTRGLRNYFYSLRAMKAGTPN